MTVILLSLHSPQALAQNSLRGNVSTRTPGDFVVGANVINKSSNTATVTDSTGNFMLTVAEADVIEISHVGYQTHSLTVNGESEVRVILQEEITSLNEVVVVGYGKTLKKDITGAVASASADDFVTGNHANPLLQLQGKIAGLSIVQPGGDPNGDLVVRIRGATSIEGQPPLLVIDGVAIDDFHRAITTLNPNDIEQYDILKDASSAAIYGARGANGVILITTKKTKQGETSIEYSGYGSIERAANKLNLLNADEWREATQDNPSALPFDQGGNTDWQDAITRTAYSWNHNISAASATENLGLRGSVGYHRQEGLIPNSGKEVITARFTANQKSADNRLDIHYNLNASAIHRNFLPGQKSTAQVRQEGSWVFAYTPMLLPVWPVYNADGSYNQSSTSFANPLWFINEIYNEQRQNFFQGSVKADYEIISPLDIGFAAAISKGTDLNDEYYPASDQLGIVSEARKTNSNKSNFTGNLHFNYKKQISRHSIDLTGVYEYNRFLNDGFSAGARGYLLRELLDNNLGTATDINPNDISSFKNEVKIISFLARLVYNFDDRYIFTANFRRDGSSKFGSNNRWGNFPSAAIAWNVVNEKFLSESDWLSNLKLRMSYGLTGNQENLPPDKFQNLYSPTGPYWMNGSVLQSYGIAQEQNPDLKWEVRKSFNLGLDFSFLLDRFFGSIDFFHDHTSDMLFLYNIPQPPFVTSQAFANSASAVNKGWEFSAGATILDERNFRWTFQGNIARVENYITKLLGEFRGVDLTIDQNYGTATGGIVVSKLTIGYPAGVFWLPVHAGLDEGGRELFNRYEDGKFAGTSLSYRDEDKIYIDPTPDFSWGITNSFRYKNLDASIFFRGVHGQKIFGNTLMNAGTPARLPGQNVTSDAMTSGFSELIMPSTYWLMDGSFLRLENVTLGYTLPVIKGFTRLRLYVVGRNLLTVTPYKGVDPEVNVDGRQRYIDAAYYPKTRSLTIGLDATF